MKVITYLTHTTPETAIMDGDAGDGQDDGGEGDGDGGGAAARGER
jgi:hypothetical protein